MEGPGPPALSPLLSPANLLFVLSVPTVPDHSYLQTANHRDALQLLPLSDGPDSCRPPALRLHDAQQAGPCLGGRGAGDWRESPHEGDSSEYRQERGSGLSPHIWVVF